MALIGYNNVVDAVGTVLAATSSEVRMGPEQLLVPVGNASTAWQTKAGVVTASLTITAANLTAFRAFCLARTNLTSAATVRVRVGMSVGSFTYDSGTIAAGVLFGVGQIIHTLPTATSGLVAQIDISDPTNPDGLLNIPLVYAGPMQATNFTPASYQGVDVGRQDNKTRSGVVLPVFLSKGRTFGFTIDNITDNNSAWVNELTVAGAMALNVLFIPREDYVMAPSESILGLLTTNQLGFTLDTGEIRNWSGVISERL